MAESKGSVDPAKLQKLAWRVGQGIETWRWHPDVKHLDLERVLVGEWIRWKSTASENKRLHKFLRFVIVCLFPIVPGMVIITMGALFVRHYQNKNTI